MFRCTRHTLCLLFIDRLSTFDVSEYTRTQRKNVVCLCLRTIKVGGVAQKLIPFGDKSLKGNLGCVDFIY